MNGRRAGQVCAWKGWWEGGGREGAGAGVARLSTGLRSLSPLEGGPQLPGPGAHPGLTHQRWAGQGLAC